MERFLNESSRVQLWLHLRPIRLLSRLGGMTHQPKQICLVPGRLQRVSVGLQPSLGDMLASLENPTNLSLLPTWPHA